jgi:NADPH:quinone reductase-like Zn-dependent oxidoreductase
LLNLGAGVFIDYTVSDVANAVTDVDLALDTVGGATTTSVVPTLREGGTLVTIAYPPETPPQLQRLWVNRS